MGFQVKISGRDSLVFGISESGARKPPYPAIFGTPPLRGTGFPRGKPDEKVLQGEVMSQRVPPSAGRWFCSSLLIVIPAHAGIQGFAFVFSFVFPPSVGDEKPERRHSPRLWIPACAGMTALANSWRGGVFFNNPFIQSLFRQSRENARPRYHQRPRRCRRHKRNHPRRLPRSARSYPSPR